VVKFVIIKNMRKEGNLYFPTEEFKKKAIVSDPKIYEEAQKDPVKFWEKLAKELFWFRKWKKAFRHSPPFFEWFSGGAINITTNIFEKNKLGWENIKKKPALIWIPEPVNEEPKIFTYEELFKKVCQFANALKKLGVKRGDRVGIYLPMIPEALISMLACARIGAVHVVVFSAFSAQALRVRLQITEAKYLITADGYWRRGKVINLKESADEGIKETQVEKIIVVKRLGNEIIWNPSRDCWWHEIIEEEPEFIEPEIMDSEDPFFILPESGTTGEFLPILHTIGGYTVQAYWTGKWVFDLHEDDIMWCVPPNTLIITNPAIKPISELKVGDKVLTHTGRFKPIERIFIRNFKGKLIRIFTLYDNTPVELTPNHKVLVLKKRRPLLTDWVEARNLRIGDYVAFPRIQKECDKKHIKISEILSERESKDGFILPKKGEKGKIKDVIEIDGDFMRLIGYYLAEGSIATDTIQLSFSLNEEEFAKDSQNLFKKIFGINARIFEYKGGLETRANSIIVSELFSRLFGHPAYKKHLPGWIFTLKKNLLWELVKGYWRGDGCADFKRRRGIRITTASKILAYQMKLILSKLGIVAPIAYLPTEKVRKRQKGRKVQSKRDSYEIAITGKSAQKFYSQFNLKEPKETYTWQKAIITTKLIFFPITKIEIVDYEGPVFNLQTASNSYTLKNLVVHNCTADIGWITSHTYGCYSPLLNGITTLIYEGAPDWPIPDRWAQIIEKNKVTIFYTAPTAIRMFEKYGEEALSVYEFENLRLLGSVGEPIDEAAWLWYFKNVGKERCPIVDTWWQTEAGGILITSLPGIGPFKPAHVGLPFPGIRAEILDDKGKVCEPGEKGNLVILPPFSPGFFRTIYKDPEKYLQTYWSKYGRRVYFTSDGAVRDENGLIRIIGRVDDVIKVAGHRISTGELEAAVNLHKEISESAVVGIPDEIKGEVPVVFAVYQGQRPVEEVQKEIVELIRKQIGPIALPKEVYLVNDLPKTRSGKIVRRILRRLFTGEDLGDLTTLANPESVEEIKKTIFKKKKI